MPRTQDWDELIVREPRDPYEPDPVPVAPPPWGTVGGPGAPGTPEPEIPDYGSFELPSYSGMAAPSFNFGPAPQFRAPQFAAPSYEQALQEPGFQFRLGAGREALESSAAARGTLRTGGTLTDLLEYGQNFGAQEYTNMFNRALQSYGANYQAAWDAFQPQMREYELRTGAARDAGLAQYNQQFNIWASMLEAALQQEQLRQNVLLQPQPTPEPSSWHVQS